MNTVDWYLFEEFAEAETNFRFAGSKSEVIVFHSFCTIYFHIHRGPLLLLIIDFFIFAQIYETDETCCYCIIG